MAGSLPDGATLGAALTAAREAAGLAIDDVSARTRIRGTVLRDLEADRVASSGGAVYARGHVKSICSAVGVDAAPYLDLFARQHGAEPTVFLQPALPIPRVVADEHLHVPTAARPERRGPNWSVAGAAALVVLLGLFVAGQLSKPDAPIADAASPPRASAEPTKPAPKPAPKPARNLTAARPAPTGAELRVRLLGGDSWVSVSSGARTLFEGVLRNGAVRDFRDPKQLRLVVGNAGAVNLVCSGRDLGPAGSQGAVRRFTCNAAGIVPA